MSKTNMKLVGGPAKRLPMSCYTIRKAEASNTRLMGVVGLYIHWVICEEHPAVTAAAESLVQPIRDIYQVYCFELEDGGLDRVSEQEGVNNIGLSRIKNGVFGGLGGKQFAVTAQEALHIIAAYAGRDALNWEQMPKGVKEVFEMAKAAKPLSPEQKEDLLGRLCQRIETVYGQINYFIMRSVPHDRDGARLLAAPGREDAVVGRLELPQKASLVRNQIYALRKEGAAQSCFCESVVDTDAGIYLMVSQLSVLPEGISQAAVKSIAKLSEWESNMLLLRPEYLVYYDIKDDDLDHFADRVDRALPRASVKAYDSGVLYMDYKTDNRHVEQQVFNIGDDLMASYYISAGGQLVIASFSVSGVIAAEMLVRTEALDDGLEPCGRYNFATPVLGHFVESGMDDFHDFLDAILDGNTE